MVAVAGDLGCLREDIVLNDIQIDVMNQFLEARPSTIYGGSNEIQRNIIAKQVLGLPSR
jgi:alkylation response protein AidB-like acyl-CoA dehydrogenase